MPRDRSAARFSRNRVLLQSLLVSDLQDLPLLCSRIEDWRRLFREAFEQGLGALLASKVAAHALSIVGGSVWNHVQQQIALDRLWLKHLNTGLAEILLLLRSRDVKAVTLKGPVLAERIYPEPHQRLSGDLDLLVAPADLYRAIGLLESIGYHLSESAEMAWPDHHHVVLKRVNSPPLELHHQASSGLGANLESLELMERAVAYVTLSGADTLVFAPEDEFIYLAVHAARHHYDRLSLVYDLVLFLRHYPFLDWRLIESRSEEWGVTYALWLSMKMLDLQFGIDCQDPRCPRRSLRLRMAAWLVSPGADRSWFFSRYTGLRWTTLRALLHQRWFLGLLSWFNYLWELILRRLKGIQGSRVQRDGRRPFSL